MELTIDTIINYVYYVAEGAFEYAEEYFGENQADLSAQYCVFTKMVSDGLLKSVVVVDVDGNEYTPEQFEKSEIDFTKVTEVNPIKF